MRNACGQHDEPHPLEAAQRERLRRLVLAAVHRLDRAAHDLGDVAGGVDDEREEQREERRVEPHAADGDPAGDVGRS